MCAWVSVCMCVYFPHEKVPTFMNMCLETRGYLGCHLLPHPRPLASLTSPVLGFYNHGPHAQLFWFSGHTLSFILGCQGENLAHPASNLPPELSPVLRLRLLKHKFKFMRTESVEHQNRMVSPLVPAWGGRSRWIYEFEVSWFHRPRLKRIKK